ncbi:MAG: ATP-binding cassette domain-containing protein [Pseudomonadota bacterium]
MTAILELDRMVKRFGGLTATNDFSASVEQGESLGLIGPNGAGKTTIFSLIMGDHLLTEGAIRFKGQAVQNLPTHERIKRGVARTYQVPRPFAEMSVAENIRIGLTPDRLVDMIFRSPDRDRELELAQSVGFEASDLDRLPAELSMGDLRKLELARTLATGAEVVLLDEVFAGLTTGEIAQVSDLINQKRGEGVTFVIVSHDLKALEPLIDRAVGMVQGTKVAEGAYGDVMADETLRAAYLGG